MSRAEAHTVSHCKEELSREREETLTAGTICGERYHERVVAQAARAKRGEVQGGGRSSRRIQQADADRGVPPIAISAEGQGPERDPPRAVAERSSGYPAEKRAPRARILREGEETMTRG